MLTPPEAMKLISLNRILISSYKSMFGPSSVPSLLISVIKKSLNPLSINGLVGKEGIVIGNTVLLEPQIKIKNPIADNTKLEKQKLKKSISKLNNQLSEIISKKHFKKTKKDNWAPADYWLIRHEDKARNDGIHKIIKTNNSH